MQDKCMKLNSEVKKYVSDIKYLSALPASSKYRKLQLEEFPFDAQLLEASSLYRTSRKGYLAIGGVFKPRVCSTMRGLSAQDLFKDQIDFTPSFSEMLWFKNFHYEVADPVEEVRSLSRFNEISLYHEQNHRIIWRLLPPAPQEKEDLRRYLNFAESLVVILDLALGDELGVKNSKVFERMKVIYRSAGKEKYRSLPKAAYREYLIALFAATYYALETIHYDDIPKAVSYVMQSKAVIYRDAVKRALEINELFTRVTNPMWQERYWQEAGKKLRQLQKNSEQETLYLPEDPLDIAEDLYLVRAVLEYFGL